MLGGNPLLSKSFDSYSFYIWTGFGINVLRRIVKSCLSKPFRFLKETLFLYSFLVWVILLTDNLA